MARGRIPALAAWLAWIVPLFLALTTLRAILNTWSPIPFQDQWDVLWWWREILRDGPRLDYLVSQHNEHRILFPRLVFFADLKWFGGRNVANYVAIALITVAGAALFVGAALRDLRPLSVLAAATAAAVIATLIQWENFFWGFQVQFVGVYAAGAWAIWLFARASEVTGRRQALLLLGAAVLLAVATYTLASGILAGLAMALAGLTSRVGWRPVIAALAATGALGALYLLGYQPVAQHGSPGLVLQEPVLFVRYLLALIGNPWGLGRLDLAGFAGAVGVAATAAMAWTSRRDRDGDVVRLAMFGIVLFAGLAMGVTAVGRLGLGIELAMSSRYATPACYFWAAQAVYWSRWAAIRGRPEQLAVAAALVVALGALLPVQVVANQSLYTTRERILVGVSAVLGGVDDAAAMAGLYPEAQRVRELGPFLRSQRLSVFAGGPVEAAGAPFARALAAPAACRGAFEALSPQQPGVWRARGWSWAPGEGRAPARVLLVDAGGRVVGVGVSGLPRRDVRAADAEVRDVRAGWIASVASPTGGGLSAYALTADGRACRLPAP